MIQCLCFVMAFAIVTVSPVLAGPAYADVGQPIALRAWPGGGVTIETMWDLHLGIRIHQKNQEYLPRVCDAVVSSADPAFALDRLPNAFSPSVQHLDTEPQLSGHAIRVQPIRLLLDAPEVSLWLIEVDGVRVLDATQFGTAAVDLKALRSVVTKGAETALLLAGADVVLVSQTLQEAKLLEITRLLKPRFMVLPPESNLVRVGEVSVVQQDHNTMAVSSARGSRGATRWIRLAAKPWSMESGFQRLFEQKESASKASQAVFAPLAVDQMNFRPKNGTHTPRWNVEHMMGTEINFFSNLYHAKDPEIPVMNLRPAQMPRQYQAAHPDWSGAEEARQMQRVQAFSRRFAYLLQAEVPPGTQPSSRIQRFIQRPQQLLTLMINHYPEHTTHVHKKMRLRDWPPQ